MEVYLVEVGGVAQGVFSTLEKAKEYCQNHPKDDCPEIVKFEMDNHLKAAIDMGSY